MHEEGDIITTDIRYCRNNKYLFWYCFLYENINNVPEFNLSYRKNIEAPVTYFRINKQVIKCIKNVKLSKCPGPDEISPRIVKRTMDSTSTALSLIFNRSLIYEEIPGDWESANVVPIFKKGFEG